MMGEQRKGGDSFGCHRSVEPQGALPQSALKLDASVPIYENELLIEAQYLNLDSASFRQIEEACKGNERKMAKMIRKIVRKRGKMQNPVTGSGGILVGKVAEVGSFFKGSQRLEEGAQIASLVSLTLTPLVVTEVLGVEKQNCQVKVSGYGILFETANFYPLPRDLPTQLVLNALDVCGAPAHVKRLLNSDEKIKKVVVIGAGGHAGCLVCAMAKKNVGEGGVIIAIEKDRERLSRIRRLGLADIYIELDCMESKKVAREVSRVTDSLMADLVIDVGNVEGMEAGAVLATKSGGTALFFNMATNFSKATLVAEGVGLDVRLLMGNGFIPGHADLVTEMLRENPSLLDVLK